MLIPLIIIVALEGFWGWMFMDMSNNPSLPPASKQNWLIAFVFLNIFAAGWYYLSEYQDRH